MTTRHPKRSFHPGLTTTIFIGLVILLISFTHTLRAYSGELTPPKWLSLIEDRGAINLKWFRVQGATSYIVQRKLGKEGEFLQIGTSGNPVFTDHDIQGGMFYFYRIIPVDKQGVRGPVSETRYFQVPLPEALLLVPPEWIAHMQDHESVSLSWTHPTSKQVLAFNLYRKSETGGFNLITSTVSTNYKDRTVKQGKSYQYVLTALDMKLQETDFSSILTVAYSSKEDIAAGDDRFASVDILEEVIQLTEPVSEYSWTEYGFISPTDVAYFPAERTLFVSDTGTGTVSVIGNDREVIRKLGGTGTEPWEFERLLGISLDDRGNLYAADAYRGEIVVFNSKGVFLERIRLADEVQKYFGEGMLVRFPWFRFGIVDTVALPGGGLFVVDNPNGWIYRLDGARSLVNVLGERGVDPGKMQYPTFAATDTRGNLFVSDTLNSRVQVFQPDGAFALELGERGLGIGQFLRPKGVVADERGKIYVSDSQHNVIQVFDENWVFHSLLGDEKGLPLDLGSPNGIAFVEPDLIYICEKVSRRIQVRRLLDTFVSEMFVDDSPEKGKEEKRILAPVVIEPGSN